MSYDVGLADRIRRKGVRVVEVAGWQARGSSTYEPHLALHHHTASSPRGATPSLAVVIYGRSDLPGPLAQVLQSREPDGDDIAYVIAAGRANHAGRGVWRGISGNSRAGGVEVEHTGTGRVSAHRREITCRILAAILEGGSKDARNACQHFEYATPAGRKIDFYDLAPADPAAIRKRVAYWIGRTSSSKEGFLMGLTDAQQTYLYDRVLRIERALTPKGDTLGSYKDSEVLDDRRLGHLIARLDERLSDKTVRWIYQRLQRLEQALTSSESGSLGTFDDIEEERTLRAQVLAELAEIKAAVVSEAT